MAIEEMSFRGGEKSGAGELRMFHRFILDQIGAGHVRGVDCNVGGSILGTNVHCIVDVHAQCKLQ